MEDHIRPGQRFAFVLRIWTEEGAESGDAGPVLRGSLQRIDSQRVGYFRTLAEVPALLREMLAWEEAES